MHMAKWGAWPDNGGASPVRVSPYFLGGPVPGLSGLSGLSGHAGPDPDPALGVLGWGSFHRYTLKRLKRSH